MPVIPLKLIRENTIRDYINQFLMNIGQNSGEEWWNSSQAGRVLSRLADATRPQVTDSSELCIDCEDALVVGIWNSGMDARALERLMRDMQNQTEKIAKEKAAGASQKITIQFLLFTNDLKSRIALEIKLDRGQKRALANAVRKTSGLQVSCRYTFVIDKAYLGESVRIREINRFDSIPMPLASGNPNTDTGENTVKKLPQSIVLTVPLRQLVALYNQVGDQLFKRNVRLGIDDKMDVNRAMCQTLEKEPEYFWYMNNGVTLLVDDPDFSLSSADSLELGRLEPDSVPGFSIINGAQTISVCSKYAFEWEYRGKNHPEEEEEAKRRLENFEKAQVILRVIHVPLRMEQNPSAEERENIRLANNISISLNRQKPVKQEDIAFTTPFVQKMLEYLEGTAEVPFCLVRRGENKGYVTQLDLVAFAKARLACVNQPGSARTVSNGEIMELEFNSDRFRKKDVFVPEWLADDPEQNSQDAVFRRFYGAVLFASQLETCYKRNQKAVQKKMQEEGCEENTLSALSNGSWYFTALLVQLLNGFSTDYSKFDYTISNVADKVPAAMKLFANMAACCADKKQVLNSNDFKKEVLFEAMLGKLKEAEGSGSFREFRRLFTNKGAEASRESIQIVYGPAFGQVVPQSVNTAADAFAQTVKDILVQFVPNPAKLETFSAWLTSDKEKCLTSHNYIKEPPNIVYNGRTYWIGTSISNNSKYLYLNRLCKVSDVPKGEVTWKKGNDTLYKW